MTSLAASSLSNELTDFFVRNFLSRLTSVQPLLVVSLKQLVTKFLVSEMFTLLGQLFN